MTTYKVSNSTCIQGYCIVHELWDGREIKKYLFKVPYNGGDIELFIKKNINQLISYTIYFNNLNAWLSGE